MRSALVIVTVQLTLFPVPLGIGIQGVTVGLLAALVAVGMALIYRANRVLNFAQGDLGMAPATVSVILIQSFGWSYFAGLAIGLPAALVVGALVELVIIRRFSRASRLILTVATIGLAQLLAVVTLLAPRWLAALTGRDEAQVAATAERIGFPWDVRLTVDPLVFNADYVVAWVVAPLALVAVGLFLRHTDVGIALRGSAERAERASTLGIPVKRLTTYVWALAATLSFVGLFLRAGVTGLPVGSAFTLTVLLSALAALMLGGLTNLPTITACAIALGVLEQGVVWNDQVQLGPVTLESDRSVLVIPIMGLVIVAALLAQRARTTRAEQDVTSSWQNAEEVRPVPARLRSLPEVRLTRHLLLAAAAAALLVLPHLLTVRHSLLASMVIIYALIALSIVVLTGWAGQLSLGQMGFVGIGAAVGATATGEWGLDLTAALVVAGLAGAGVATLLGLPALRLRGLYLGVVTLAFGVATTSYFLDRQFFGWVPAGRIERPPLLGQWHLDSPTRIYYVCLGGFALVAYLVHGIRQSRTGRVLVALRESEQAAQSYGVGVLRAKLTAFAISGFVAAFAGGLLVHHQQALSLSLLGAGPGTMVDVNQNLMVFTAAVVGGLGSVLGAVLGAVYLQGGRWFLPEELWLLSTSAGVLVVLLLAPGGLGGLLYRVRDLGLRWVAQRRSLTQRPPQSETVQPDDLTPVHSGTGARSQPERSESLLKIRDLEVAYGDVQVLFGVDFEVAEGDIVALLGTNGAGKSTLLKAISGVVGVRRGAVVFDGQEVTRSGPNARAAQGVIQMPGGQGVFPSLTVAENLRLAGWLNRGDRDGLAAAIDQVYEELPALRERAGYAAADLSGGQQQMLALGMVLVTKPRLLLIDELSLGLAPVVVEQLLGIVRQLRDRGVTIVLVEQSVNVALTLAEDAYFMEKGEIRFHGPTGELLERGDVLRAVFLEGAEAGLRTKASHPPPPSIPAKGADLSPSTSRSPAAGTSELLPAQVRTPDVPAGDPPPFDAGPSEVPALEIVEASCRFGGIRAVDRVTLSVERGEIVGLIGPNGAGKTTLFDIVSGYHRDSRGRLVLGRHDITNAAPEARATLGLGRSFQDAHLFPNLTVEDTIKVALDRWTKVRGPLAAALRLPAAFDSEEQADRQADELIGALGLEELRDRFVRELSTGTRRIVDLACIMAHRPSVVLLDEPSSGIAQREAEALAPAIRGLRDELGAGVLVIEHDIPLVTSVSDRLIALDQGRIVAQGAAAAVVHHPHVVASYLGTTDEVIARSGARAGPTTGQPTQTGQPQPDDQPTQTGQPQPDDQPTQLDDTTRQTDPTAQEVPGGAREA